MRDPHETERESRLRRAVLRGDDRAWAEWYRDSFDALARYVHHRTSRNVAETEEVLQEVWLVAVRRIREFDPERASFLSWLRGITDHVVANRRRVQVRRGAKTRELVDEPFGVQPDPLEEGERTMQIATVMASLPDGYRSLLRLRYDELVSVSEIAEREGATTKAIESRLARARAAFRDGYRRLRGDR